MWSEETFNFRHSANPVIIMCDEAIPDSLKNYSPSTAYIFVKDKQEIQSVIDQISEELYKTDAEYLADFDYEYHKHNIEFNERKA